jgi:hypothetical protein
MERRWRRDLSFVILRMAVFSLFYTASRREERLPRQADVGRDTGHGSLSLQRHISHRHPKERMASIMRHNGWFEERLRARKLGSASIERQSRIVKMAIEHFGGNQAAIAFLNETDDHLGGSPLAVATRSEAGFRKVVRRLSPYLEPERPVRRYPPLSRGSDVGSLRRRNDEPLEMKHSAAAAYRGQPDIPIIAQHLADCVHPPRDRQVA